MKIHTVEQRTPEWFALRCGKLTGSCAKDILATGRSGGEAVVRRDLRYRLVAERITGRPQEDTYVNDAMKWGIEHEAEAVAAYEAVAGCFIDPIGFCEHDSLPVGTSPDGFIGADGILSIKCPKTATQIRYIRDGLEPAEHAAQNTHELWLTGRKFVEFVSYDPRLPAGLQLFIRRVTRTQKELDSYEAFVLAFLNDVERELRDVLTLQAREQAVA